MDNHDKELLLKALIDKGVANGKINSSEIDAVIVEADVDMEKMDEIYSKLESKGVGEMAPDFTLKNTKGKGVSLKSLRGKWIVLDFWATWCGPCKVSMPHLKEYYKKYAGKFEVIGVVGSSKEEDWKVMVNDLELPWINVINPKGVSKEKDLTNMYGIEGFPTYIILNKEGKIHKEYLGAQPDFYKELDAILK